MNHDVVFVVVKVKREEDYINFLAIKLTLNFGEQNKKLDHLKWIIVQSFKNFFKS